MRVIRRDVGAAPPSEILSYAAAALGSLGLLVWYSGSFVLTAWTLLGTLGALLLFGAMATVLLTCCWETPSSAARCRSTSMT